MSLHKEFYDFREKVWKALEELVHKGCDYIGEFPISVGEYTLPPKGLRTSTTRFGDTCDIVIYGIKANPSYYIHPPKQSEKDINVITNKITVIVEEWSVSGSKMSRVKVEKKLKKSGLFSFKSRIYI